MTAMKKDDSAKKEHNAFATPKGGTTASSGSDNKRNDNSKEGRTAKTNKADAKKKGMSDGKNPKSK